MKIILWLFLINIFMFPALQAQEFEELKNSIDSLLQTEKGEFAVAFKDLTEEKNQVLINEHENFHAASTMKTPVMMEVFKQVSEGKFKLSDSLEIKNEFKSIQDGSLFSLDINRDSGDHLYDLIGKKRSIEDLVVDMIIHSSNLATNIVIELVDAKNVNNTMKELGANNINVLRGVEDMKAYNAGMNNTTTAFDLMLIFENLGKGTAVDPASDDKMIDILLKQQHRDLIPSLLPDNLQIANKTGWIDGVHHDSALIFLPGGRKYVLVLLSKNMKDMEMGTRMLAQVSEKVYEFMVNEF